MEPEDAKSKFEDRLQSAIDWAITDGLTVEDMKGALQEIINNMVRYPEEFQPVE